MAPPWRVWREVDLPAIWPGLAVAAGFAFAISLGEFGATVFLARPDEPTLPIAVYRFLGRPGDLMVGQALAMTGAPAVDVSSGVEVRPGVKDPSKIADFIRAVREADAARVGAASSV